MTTWKPIPVIEGYEASDEGHIRNAKTQQQLYESPINTGYLTVSCAKYGQRLVHRLVCAAFHSYSDPSMQVNHINGIKTDNRPENLEWMSLGDNVRDFWQNPDFAEKQQARRKQISENIKNRIWITNGTLSYRVLPEELENYPGFHEGRTYHRRPSEC